MIAIVTKQHILGMDGIFEKHIAEPMRGDILKHSKKLLYSFSSINSTSSPAWPWKKAMRTGKGGWEGRSLS